MKKFKQSASNDRLHLLRLIVLLDLMTGNCGVRTSTLLRQLEERNIVVSKRQLLRDLSLLSELFLIDLHQIGEGSSVWSWYGGSGLWAPCEPHVVLGDFLPMDESLRPDALAGDLDLSQAKLLRVLMAVEFIPLWGNDDRISMRDLHRRLLARGLRVGLRTVQRDTQFIREHFLVSIEKDRYGVTQLQRLEHEEWQTSFCPRLPEMNSNDELELELFREVQLKYPHHVGAAW